MFHSWFIGAFKYVLKFIMVHSNHVFKIPKNVCNPLQILVDKAGLEPMPERILVLTLHFMLTSTK